MTSAAAPRERRERRIYWLFVAVTVGLGLAAVQVRANLDTASDGHDLVCASPRPQLVVRCQ
jgi:hypothetical protein